MAQMHFSDETLMAYADGEIEETVARTIEEAMGLDPDISRKVAGFQRSRRIAKQALASSGEPVPDALRAAVEAEIRAREGATVIPLTRRRGFSRVLGGLAALAASVVVFFGVAGHYVATGPDAVGGGPMVAGLADPAIGQILDRAPTGATEATAFGNLRLVSTFRTDEGALCREVSLDQPMGTTQAVACGSPGTEWTITFAKLGPKAGDSFEPASGDASVVDGYLDAIGAGAPLTGAEEAAALAGK